MLSDLLPPMCSDCGAGDDDLRLIGEFPAEARPLLGSVRAVTTRAYQCRKCGTTFTHNIPRVEPAAVAVASPPGITPVLSE